MRLISKDFKQNENTGELEAILTIAVPADSISRETIEKTALVIGEDTVYKIVGERLVNLVIQGD